MLPSSGSGYHPSDHHGSDTSDLRRCRLKGCFGSRLFSNSGFGVKLSVHILAGSRVLSAVRTGLPHDGVR
jgi:hypothetical protein